MPLPETQVSLTLSPEKTLVDVGSLKSWGEVGGSGTRKELIQYFHHQLKIFLFLLAIIVNAMERIKIILKFNSLTNCIAKYVITSLQKKIGFIQHSLSDVNWHYLRVTVPRIKRLKYNNKMTIFQYCINNVKKAELMHRQPIKLLFK